MPRAAPQKRPARGRRIAALDAVRAAGGGVKLKLRRRILRLARPAAGSLAGRVAALLILGAVPLIGMLSLVSYQDYRLARQVPLDRAALLRGAGLAGFRTAMAATADVLTALARSPEVRGGDPATCQAFLNRLIDLHRTGYSNIGVVGPDGRLWCSALPAAQGASYAERRWFADASARPGELVQGLVETGVHSGTANVAAALGLREDGRFLGVVVAGLRADWFAAHMLPEAEGAAGWLVDAGDQILPLGGSMAVSPPAPALLDQLMHTSEVLEGPGINGRAAAYAAVALDTQLHLVVGTGLGADGNAATWRLLSHGILLGLVLLGAFALVVMGADAAVVAPVRRVSRAVAAWERGGRFSVSRPELLPEELRHLAETFAAATARLAAREVELSRVMARQDLLMQEIHHRVKNNLQIVASLLNLQASRIRLPEARAEFQSARDRVRALATLHRHLYAEGELHSVAMRSFLAELCGQLFQAMGETPGDRITLEIETTDVQMLSDQAVPLALIVTEAVGNALKYAFPGGRRGHVQVRLDGTDDAVRLIVEDDGVGIPAGRAETETGTRDGIGLQLIRGFARQLGAVLTIDQGIGTRYVVEVPLRRERRDEPDDVPDDALEPGTAGK